MKTTLLATLLLTGCISVQANTIALWTFETSRPASAGPFSPEMGNGSAAGAHASLSTAWSSPTGNGSTSSFSSDHWSLGDYWQFQVTTLGYESLSVSWDQISSSTGPGVFGLYYSTDGSTFIQFGANYSVLANVSPNAWSSSGSPKATSHYVYDLSSVAALNNASTVYFRLVDKSTNSPSGGAVGSSGTDRVDNFLVAGAEIPAMVPDSLPVVFSAGMIWLWLGVSRRFAAQNSSAPLLPMRRGERFHVPDNSLAGRF